MLLTASEKGWGWEKFFLFFLTLARSPNSSIKQQKKIKQTNKRQQQSKITKKNRLWTGHTISDRPRAPSPGLRHLVSFPKALRSTCNIGTNTNWARQGIGNGDGFCRSLSPPALGLFLRPFYFQASATHVRNKN